MDLLERAKQKLDNINLDNFLELEEPEKEQEDLTFETIKKSKEPKKKRKGISERKLNKRKTLDAIYNLGKENIDNITDIKLKSILEDIKVYSRRK